jgi:large subunit ribosomal protein L15
MLFLEDLVRIVKNRKRVGRGRTRGRKCGRGNEGQLARSGGRAEIKPSFEGGQMSLCRRLPRRGFINRSKTLFEIVSLPNIVKAFGPGDTVNRTTLLEKGLIKGKSKHLVKVLGPSAELVKMSFVVDAISRSAVESIEKVGGIIQAINKG